MGGTKQIHKAERAVPFNFLVLAYLMTQLDENGMGSFTIDFCAKKIVTIKRIGRDVLTDDLITDELIDPTVLTKS